MGTLLQCQRIIDMFAIWMEAAAAAIEVKNEQGEEDGKTKPQSRGDKTQLKQKNNSGSRSDTRPTRETGSQTPVHHRR